MDIKEKRGLHHKVFSLGGHKYRLQLNRKLMHYLTADNQLLDIDLNMELKNQHYVIDKAPYILSISEVLPRYVYESALGNVSVDVISIDGVPPDIKKSSWDVSQKCAKWDKIAPHTDYIIKPEVDGVSVFFELKNQNAPRNWKWYYTGSDHILQPIKGWDAEGNICELDVVRSNGTATVTWNGLVTNSFHAQGAPRPDPVYPVRIDPTINAEISYNIDDAATTIDTIFDTSSANLVAGTHAYGDNWVGFRFRNIIIPNAAVITTATLGVYVNNDNGSAHLDVYGDDQDDADTWSSGEVKGHATTTAVTAFDNPGTGSKSIDVTAQVQEIVDRAGWVSGNAMRFSIRYAGGGGTNYIGLDAREKSGSNHATLSIEYEDAAGAGGAVWM